MAGMRQICRPDFDGKWRVEILLHDGMAHWLWHRAGGIDQGHVQSTIAIHLSPNSIAQYAAVAALDGPLDFMPKTARCSLSRRQLVCDALNDIDGIDCRHPDGALCLSLDRQTDWQKAT